MDPRGQKHMTNDNGPFFKGQSSGPGRVSQLLVLTLIKLSTEQSQVWLSAFSCNIMQGSAINTVIKQELDDPGFE
jgi:hypothetical protein